MNQSDRLFSVPYNGAPAAEYISTIEPYFNHIHSVFLGLPSLLDTHPRYKDKSTAEINTLDFLSKDIPCNRYLTLNKAHYHRSDRELTEFVEQDVFPILDTYHIEGIIVTDFNMARFIHQFRPDVKLSTSCNTFMYNVKAMQRWKEYCGVTLFNVPRDSMRMPGLLKKMHEQGFQLKCIVNESCLYGCAQQMMHCFTETGRKTDHYRYQCQRLKDPADILRCNWILPRWLPYFDEYVSVYKIVGRGATTKRISTMLDAYINERDDIWIDDIIYGGAYRGSHYNIPTSAVPDKLLTCNCMECGTTCNLCNEVIKKWC